MAPLTWRNVDAPNFSNVGDSLRTASALLSNGASGLSDALGSFSKQAQAGDSAAAMAGILGYTDADALGNALRSGTALGGINPRNLSPDAINFLANRQNSLIQNQGANLRNAGQGIQNNTAQFNLDQGQAAAARGDSYRANQPQANEILTQARALYDSGNADQIAQGRKLITDNSRVFTSAGMNASDILNTMVANTAAAGEGIKMGQNIAADQDFYRKRFETDGARGVLNAIVSDPTVTDLASAQSKVKSIPNLTADQISSLNKTLTDNAAAYFPAPNVLDTLPVRGTSPTDILKGASTGTQNPSGNQLPPLFQAGLDRTEGGGNYSTLFGNAQNRNSPFAGVDVSKMTVGQAVSFAKDSGYGQYVKEELRRTGQDPRVATPMGRHQIVGSTLETAAKEMGLDPNTPFDGPTQDAVALHIAQKAISGPRTMMGKIEALRGQWEGLKNVPDAQVSRMVNEIESASGATPSAPLDPSQISNQNFGSFTSTPTAGQGILNNVISNATNNLPVQVASTLIPSDTLPVVNSALATTAAAPGDAAKPVEATPAERNAQLLSSLQKVSTGGGNEAYKDTNGTLFTADGNGGFQSVSDNGVPNGGGSYTPQALAAAQKAAAPAAQVPPALTPTQLIQNAQTVSNTGIIDNLSNDQSTLETMLSQRPDRGKSVSDIAKIVADKTGVPSTAATQAIREIMQNNNVDADVAGYLAQQSPEARDLSFSPLANTLGFGIPNMFFAGDRFGRATEGRTGPRIDTNRATELLKNFRTQNSDQAGANSPGVSRLNTAQNQQQAQAQVQLLQVQATALQSRVLALSAALQRNPGNPQVQQALQTAQAQLETVNASLNQVNRQGQIAPYIRSTVNQ